MRVPDAVDEDVLVGDALWLLVLADGVDDLLPSAIEASENCAPRVIAMTADVAAMSCERRMTEPPESRVQWRAMAVPRSTAPGRVYAPISRFRGSLLLAEETASVQRRLHRVISHLRSPDLSRENLSVIGHTVDLASTSVLRGGTMSPLDEQVIDHEDDGDQYGGRHRDDDPSE